MYLCLLHQKEKKYSKASKNVPSFNFGSDWNFNFKPQPHEPNVVLQGHFSVGLGPSQTREIRSNTIFLQ